MIIKKLDIHAHVVLEKEYPCWGATNGMGLVCEELREMYALIRRLGPLERTVVLLYLEENSYQQIADITGLTLCNVATKLKRAKIKLRQMVNA